MRFLVDAQLPARLARQLTGNITNDAPMALFEEHLDAIVAALGEHAWLSWGPTGWWSTTPP
ncbi:MAG: hypothetical protein M3159_02310 [Actinomycetota bacterium]|nr:hypothetical protein [Actinomycetota bacterium]